MEKHCYKCGRDLKKKEFYKCKNGKLSCYCKYCERTLKKEYYAKKLKKRDGIFCCPKTGRAIKHIGYSVSIDWSNVMLQRLKREYPYTKNEVLCITFSVSMRTLIRKARELGLRKDVDWMRKISQDNVKMAIFKNKICGNSGMIHKGEHKSKSTEFKRKVVIIND